MLRSLIAIAKFEIAMKPHHFALCAATCLVVLSSNYDVAEARTLNVPTQPHTMAAPIDQDAILALAYITGVVDIARQRSQADPLKMMDA